MLIARAPVRISFAGGGTDFPDYYREHGGLVVSTTIDKYFYVIANLNGSESAQITSSDFHTFFRQKRGQPVLYGGDLSLPRAFLNQFGIDSGLSLFLASEVPPGTGLGSSSSVSVALAKALSAICGLSLDAGELAQLAAYVEIEKLGMPIGLQDQYAAAYGGLNAIYFEPAGVRVEPLRLRPDVQRSLEQRTLLFFTGISRRASSILKDQQAAAHVHDASVVGALHRIKHMAEQTILLLRSGDLAGFGALLHDSWQAKKRLARGISNTDIDRWYEIARSCGATGGKIAGAGGGGFLMLYCEEAYQEPVTAALEAQGLARMDFHLERSGAMVLVDSLPRIRAIGKPEHAVSGVPALASMAALAADSRVRARVWA